MNDTGVPIKIDGISINITFKSVMRLSAIDMRRSNIENSRKKGDLEPSEMTLLGRTKLLDDNDIPTAQLMRLGELVFLANKNFSIIHKGRNIEITTANQVNWRILENGDLLATDTIHQVDALWKNDDGIDDGLASLLTQLEQ